MGKHILIESRTQYTTLSPLVKACQDLGIPYSIFSYFRETNEVVGVPETESEFFTFSTTGPLLCSINNTPLTFLDDYHEPINQSHLQEKFYRSFIHSMEGFDQRYAFNHNLPMMNIDGEFFPMSKAKHFRYPYPVFIKPSNDLKTFTASVTEAGDSIEETVLKHKYMPDWEDSTVLVAPLKDVASEYRFFVHNNLLLTGSKYFENGKVCPDSTIPDHVLEFAKSMTSIFSPASSYTIDVGVMRNGALCIVEYNCFNISGIYKSNAKMLIDFVSNE